MLTWKISIYVCMYVWRLHIALNPSPPSMLSRVFEFVLVVFVAFIPKLEFKSMWHGSVVVVVSFAFVFASSLLFYFTLALQNSFRLLRHEYNFFEFVCVFFPTNYTKYIVVFVLSISIMQTHTRSSTALSASILLTSPFNFSLLNENNNKQLNTNNTAT